MTKRTRRRFQRHVEQVKRWLAERPLAFAFALSEDLVRRVLAERGIEFRERVDKPWITLWTFVSQMLSANGSCQEAQGKRVFHNRRIADIVMVGDASWRTGVTDGS